MTNIVEIIIVLASSSMIVWLFSKESIRSGNSEMKEHVMRFHLKRIEVENIIKKGDLLFNHKESEVNNED